MRVGLRVEVGGKYVETPALANAGYESETPQVLIPVQLAKEFGLWPPKVEHETTFETAGGPLRVWAIPAAAKVRVVEEDASSPDVVSDVVVSPLADEVLLSDSLIGDLGISLEDAKRGLWRFRWEPVERLRRSHPPKYWR